MMPYVIKCAALLALFYSFYLLFMRRTTFFGFNRGALLLGSAVCLLMSAIKIESPSIILPEYMPHLQIDALTVTPDNSVTASGIGFMDIVTVLYLIGAAVTLIVEAVSFFRTIEMLKSGEIIRRNGYTITLVEKDTPSFSFLRHIVISRSDYENYPAVISHELAHLDAHHSADILLFSVLSVFQWFNPLVWIAKSELKMIHEYEADEKVIKQGIDATQYQLLLVKKAVGARYFQMANGFNHAKLKNRITMMQKSKTNKWNRLGYLAALPILTLTLCFCTNNESESKDDNELDEVNVVGYGNKNAEQNQNILPIPDERPIFNGGDASEFSKWVKQRIIYPQTAKDAGEEGKVLVSFQITAEGEMSNVRILRGVSEALDNEAIRVIKSSPDWIPGKKDGVGVPVTYTFPVVFSLRQQ